MNFVSPGDFFDRARVVSEPSRFVAQPGVLRPRPRDRRRQLVVLTAGAQQREQAAIAREGVGDEDRGDEQEQQVQDPTAAHRRARGSRSTSGGRSRVVCRHGGAETVQERGEKYKRRIARAGTR